MKVADWFYERGPWVGKNWFCPDSTVRVVTYLVFQKMKKNFVPPLGFRLMVRGERGKRIQETQGAGYYKPYLDSKTAPGPQRVQLWRQLKGGVGICPSVPMTSRSSPGTVRCWETSRTSAQC